MLFHLGPLELNVVQNNPILVIHTGECEFTNVVDLAHNTRSINESCHVLVSRPEIFEKKVGLLVEAGALEAKDFK